MKVRKLIRKRFCNRCGKLFEATGKWVYICDECKLKNKKNKEVKGFKKLPKWLKIKYCEAVNYKCQMCNTCFEFKELQIHRIKRGKEGGLYTVAPLHSPKNNVKVVCKSCHKLIHSKEKW